MKNYRYQCKNLFLLIGIVLVCLALSVGCARKPSPKISTMPSLQSEPPTIELDANNGLREGDIPEENRNDLSWLPRRPPQGMQFEATSELETVHFEFDKYSLTGEAKAILEKNAAWLRNNPNVSVQIEGHCDDRGTLEYNQVLGDNRAMTVRKYLMGLGINGDKLYTISYGETQPVDPAQTEEAWAQNRRAEFKIAQ